MSCAEEKSTAARYRTGAGSDRVRAFNRVMKKTFDQVNRWSMRLLESCSFDPVAIALGSVPLALSSRVLKLMS